MTGIGMIHQHFKLVDIFTAAENIVLGLEGDKGKLDKNQPSRLSSGILPSAIGFDIDPDQKVYNMSVSQKQTVEIVKVLYPGGGYPDPRRADGSADTAGDGKALQGACGNMRADGKAIIIITHKLNEVLAVSRPGRGAAEGQVHRQRRDGGRHAADPD